MLSTIMKNNYSIVRGNYRNVVTKSRFEERFLTLDRASLVRYDELVTGSWRGHSKTFTSDTISGMITSHRYIIPSYYHMGGGLFRNLMTNQIRYFTSIKMSDDEINELNKSWSNPEETVESVDSNVNSTVTTPQARSTSKVEGRKVEESALSKELASLRESVAQLTSDNKDLRSKLSASETSGLGNETIVPEAISQPADITGQIEFVRSRRDWVFDIHYGRHADFSQLFNDFYNTMVVRRGFSKKFLLTNFETYLPNVRKLLKMHGLLQGLNYFKFGEHNRRVLGLFGKWFRSFKPEYDRFSNLAVISKIIQDAREQMLAMDYSMALAFDTRVCCILAYGLLRNFLVDKMIRCKDGMVIFKLENISERGSNVGIHWKKAASGEWATTPMLKVARGQLPFRRLFNCEAMYIESALNNIKIRVGDFTIQAHELVHGERNVLASTRPNSSLEMASFRAVTDKHVGNLPISNLYTKFLFLLWISCIDEIKDDDMLVNYLAQNILHQMCSDAGINSDDLLLNVSFTLYVENMASPQWQAIKARMYPNTIAQWNSRELDENFTTNEYLTGLFSFLHPEETKEVANIVEDNYMIFIHNYLYSEELNLSYGFDHVDRSITRYSTRDFHQILIMYRYLGDYMPIMFDPMSIQGNRMPSVNYNEIYSIPKLGIASLWLSSITQHIYSDVWPFQNADMYSNESYPSIFNNLVLRSTDSTSYSTTGPSSITGNIPFTRSIRPGENATTIPVLTESVPPKGATPSKTQTTSTSSANPTLNTEQNSIDDFNYSKGTDNMTGPIITREEIKRIVSQRGINAIQDPNIRLKSKVGQHVDWDELFLCAYDKLVDMTGSFGLYAENLIITCGERHTIGEMMTALIADWTGGNKIKLLRTLEDLSTNMERQNAFTYDDIYNSYTTKSLENTFINILAYANMLPSLKVWNRLYDQCFANKVFEYKNTIYCLPKGASIEMIGKGVNLEKQWPLTEGTWVNELFGHDRAKFIKDIIKMRSENVFTTTSGAKHVRYIKTEVYFECFEHRNEEEIGLFKRQPECFTDYLITCEIKVLVSLDTIAHVILKHDFELKKSVVSIMRMTNEERHKHSKLIEINGKWFYMAKILVLVATNDHVFKDGFYEYMRMYVNKVNHTYWLNMEDGADWTKSPYYQPYVNKINDQYEVIDYDYNARGKVRIRCERALKIISKLVKEDDWKGYASKFDEDVKDSSKISDNNITTLYPMSVLITKLYWPIDARGKWCKGMSEVNINTNYKNYLDMYRETESKKTLASMTDWDRIVRYHSSNEINPDYVTRTRRKGVPMDVFCKDPDFKYKVRLFEILFGVKCNDYTDMKAHCDDMATDLEMPNTKLAIVNEPGRIKGYLQNNSEGLEKIIGQLSAMAETKPAQSMFERSNWIIKNITTNEAMDDRLEMAHALLSMPLNSSSGIDSRTALQYVSQYRYEELLQENLNSDRRWKLATRLDSGGNVRAVFNRSVSVRLFEYMMFRHLYDQIRNLDVCTMGKDILDVERMLFNETHVDSDYLSLDYSKFDTTVSSVDIYRIKEMYGKAISSKKTHMMMEEYDYPLYEGLSGDWVLRRADRLMSGDYITGVVNVFAQMCNYDNINKHRPEIGIRPKALIGDDAVVMINKNVDTAIVEQYYRTLGIIMSKEKSMRHNRKVGYNRRIWERRKYPFNSIYTFINSIWRVEKQVFNKIDYNKRLYENYVSMVAYKVLTKYFEERSAMNTLMDDMMNELHGSTFKHLLVQDVDVGRKKVVYREYPLIRDLSNEIEGSLEELTYFRDLFEANPKAVLSRYIQSPYIDEYIGVTKAVGTGAYSVSTRELTENYFRDVSRKYPYWVTERASKIYRWPDLRQKLFCDVLSRLSLPIKNVGVYVFRDTETLIESVNSYLEAVFPDTDSN